MEKIKEIWHRIFVTFSLMPFILRYITIFCLAGGLLFITGPILPFGRFHINETEVSQSQFWIAGYGPSVIFVGILLLSSAIGLIYKKRWSRWLLCLLLLMLFVAQFIYYFVSGKGKIELPHVVIYLIYLVAFYLYFFKKNTVRDYFML